VPFFALHLSLSLASSLVFARNTNGVPHLSPVESVVSLFSLLWWPVLAAGSLPGVRAMFQ
jgi:hypothetical protein